ncbi:MAG: rod shape-determining protein MreD [Firmicutes bacterium]|nr:rod shape-determining protein MreD [Bacillota bacterium]
MVRYWKSGAAFLAAFLVQPSLLNVINIKGYTPNLLLCLVVVLSFLYEEEMYGVVFGALFGVLYDICYSSVIGPAPIGLVSVAIVILFLREYANIENIINLWVVSIISIVLYYFLNWGLHFVGGNPIGIIYVLKDLPWTGLYSLFVITVIYLVLIRKVVRYRKDRYFR